MAQIEAKSWGAGISVPEGRCNVNLDESALRMLEPAQHRRNSAQSSFHSFKYHFKPESIDVRKPGKVQPANPPRVVQEGVALDVEQLGSNNDDKHLFTAVEQATKDLDVFMVFDPITGEFTMYEADSSVVLTYDRAASKAASRSRSRASPTTQPIAIPPVPTPLPKPTPVTLPTASVELSATGASAAPVKRPAIQKAKTTKPRPKPKLPVKEPTPPPLNNLEETEEGELEPVTVPGQTSAMDLDAEQFDMDDQAKDSETADANGILPWESVPVTSHRRIESAATAFNTADAPDEEVLVFGGSFGSSTRDPPRKTQPKPGRSGGIVFPKPARGRENVPRAPPPPPPVEPDDDDMEEIVLPGMEPHSNDLEDEMMKQLQGESSEEEDDDDGGFDVEAFQQAMAQEVSQEEGSQEEEESDSDEDSSSEEDD